MDGHDLYKIILRLTVLVIVLYFLDTMLGSALKNTIKESHPGLLDSDPFAEQNPQSSPECLKDDPPDKCNVEHNEIVETVCAFPPETLNGKMICPPGFLMVRDMQHKPPWYTGEKFQDLCCDLPNDDEMHRISQQWRLAHEIGTDILISLMWSQFTELAYRQMVKSLSRTIVGQGLSRSKTAFAAGVRAKVNLARQAGGRLAARTASRALGTGLARSAARGVGKVSTILIKGFAKGITKATMGSLKFIAGGPVGIAMLFVDLAFMLWDFWDPSGYNNLVFNSKIQEMRDAVEYQFQSSIATSQMGSYPVYFPIQWMYPNEYSRAIDMLQGYYLQKLFERAETGETHNGVLISDIIADAFIGSARLGADPTDTTTVADQVDSTDPSSNAMSTFSTLLANDMNSDPLARDNILELFIEREICYAKQLRTEYDVCDWWHFNQCTEKPTFSRKDVRLGKKWREVAEEEFDYTPNPIEDDKLLAEINKSTTQVEYTRAREFYQARGDVFILSRPYVPGNTNEMAVVMCSDKRNPGVVRYFEPVLVELEITARFRDGNENYTTQTKKCNKVRYVDTSNVRYKKWVEVSPSQTGVTASVHDADGTLASLCMPTSTFTMESAGNYTGGRLYVISDASAAALSFQLHPNKIVRSGNRYFRQMYLHIPEWPVYTNRMFGTVDADIMKIDVFLNELAKHTGVCTGHTAAYFNMRQSENEVTSIDLCDQCECLPGIFKYNNEYFQTLPPLPWCSNKVDQRGDGYKVEIMGNAGRFRGPITVDGLMRGTTTINPSHWETNNLNTTPYQSGSECTADRFALQPSEIACHLWNYYHETEWFLRDSFSTLGNEYYIDGWVCPQMAIYANKFPYVTGGTTNSPNLSTQSFGNSEKRALVIYGIDAVYKMCMQPTGGSYPRADPVPPWPAPDDSQQVRIPRQYGVWFDYDNRICRFTNCWCHSFEVDFKTDRNNVDNGIDCHIHAVQDFLELIFGTSIVRAFRSIGSGSCQ